MSDQSKLRFFSVAIVLHDKELKSDYIYCSAMEQMSLSEGKLNEVEIKRETTLPDREGVSHTTETVSNLKIKAKWIPFSDPNRITAPDVIKNETVLLWKYADTDDFYWCTMFREPKLRRLETVLWAFGNIPKFGEAWDKATSYWMEWSTHEKRVQIHTADNDGEVTTYDIIIDSGNGSVTITDGPGNMFQLNTNQNEVLMKTAEDAHITITGRNILTDCDQYVINCKTLEINASDSVTINSPQTTVNGNFTVTGQTNMKSLSADGAIILTGGPITANGEDLTVDLT